jgi:hypothetical protein
VQILNLSRCVFDVVHTRFRGRAPHLEAIYRRSYSESHRDWHGVYQMIEQHVYEHESEPFSENEVRANARDALGTLSDALTRSAWATASSAPAESPANRLCGILPQVDIVAGDFMYAALNSLSREEFQRIPARLFGAMSAREVADLSPRSMTRLTADQWLELTSTVVNSRRNNQVAVLRPEQVQALTAEHIQSIYPWRMPYMPVEQFTNTQLTQLTREQVDALTSQQLADIGSMRLEHLFQNRNLPEAARHLLRIGPEQLRALGVRQTFPPETLPHILPGMFGAFSSPQLRELLCDPGTTRPNSARINSLTESQIHALQLRRGFSNEPWSTAVRERANQFNSFDY